MTRYHTTADGNIPFTPEEEAERDAEEAALSSIEVKRRQDVLAQIAALEAKATPRRMREAVKGTGKAWLDDLDDQIAALRAGL